MTHCKDRAAWRRRTLEIVVAAGLASSCGCVLGGSGDNGAVPPGDKDNSADGKTGNAKGVPEARVRGGFQDKMLALLGAKDTLHGEAWGLFSEGGWSDAGQIAVLVAPDRQSGRLLAARPNKPDWIVDRAIEADELARVLAAVKDADSLEDVDIESFDTVTFEYVHAKRDASGAATVLKRVFVKNPGSKPTPKHEALITALETLREAATKGKK
jgi:hypothetical protein